MAERIHIGKFEDLLGGRSMEEVRADLVVAEQQEWEEMQAEYEVKPEDFLAAWNYLDNHPIFRADHPLVNLFRQTLDIFVTRVNPETEKVDDDKSKNTKTEVWLETGPTHLKSEKPDLEDWQWYDSGVMSNVHDPRLDGGGATFEEAIIKVASLVKENYGNDRSKVYEE